MMLQVMFVIIKEWKSFADADTSQLFFDLFYMFLLTLSIVNEWQSIKTFTPCSLVSHGKRKEKRVSCLLLYCLLLWSLIICDTYGWSKWHLNKRWYMYLPYLLFSYIGKQYGWIWYSDLFYFNLFGVICCITMFYSAA